MNKTTLALAFCATLLITSTAAAMVIAQTPPRKPAKRKGETDIATRVFTPVVKAGKKVIDREPTVVAAESKPETATTIAKPACEANPEPMQQVQPVVASEGEPEVITDYYPDGRVRAVYRGYRHNIDASCYGHASTITFTLGKVTNLDRDVLLKNATNNSTNEIIQSEANLYKSEQNLQVEVQTKLIENINTINNDTTVGYIVFEMPATRHGAYESYYENGTLESRGEYDHGNYKGYWAFYHDNGQVREAGEFVNNARNGHWTSYYANGLRAGESDWVNGVENGTHTDWYANGLMAATGAMKNGQREGFWTYWSEDGAKLREGSYENGNETGDWHNYQDIAKQVYYEQEASDNTCEYLGEAPATK